MSNDFDIVDFIKSTRENNCLSISELALQVGIKPVTLENIEKKKFNPDFNTVLAILKNLGFDINIVPSALENNIENIDNFCSLVKNSEEQAILSHFLHLQGSGFEIPYKKSALQILQKLNLTLEQISKSITPTFKSSINPSFTFIDLFAGIGGFRIALQNLGGKCVFSSEWNPAAQQTYFKNFGDIPFGDITLPKTKEFIPKNFDVLCAGFPCQAFSIAGYQKGFEDTRGTLFFDIADILRVHRPKAFYLENVKNLASHDNGNTFNTILRVLEKELGYNVFFQIMNPIEYANIPQNRERVFIIGLDPTQISTANSFEFPSKVKLTSTIHDCIEQNVSDEVFYYRETQRYYPELIKGMKSKDTVYQWRRQYVRENKSNVCPTLTANMGAGGHNVPLILTDNGIRKLTPKECLNFQGFPKEYTFPNLAISKCYMQAGNSVTVPLIQRVATNLVKKITK